MDDNDVNGDDCNNDDNDCNDDDDNDVDFSTVCFPPEFHFSCSNQHLAVIVNWTLGKKIVLGFSQIVAVNNKLKHFYLTMILLKKDGLSLCVLMEQLVD